MDITGQLVCERGLHRATAQFVHHLEAGNAISPAAAARVSLPRERFWDIPVPKIDSPTRQPLLPRP
ncbi:MAG: hypothetical protein AB2815_00125, partial [Candidatus Sedimenticola endophacoides]